MLRNRLIEVTTPPCIGAAILHRGNVHIAISIERHVPAALQNPADVVDVFAGLDRQIIGRFNPRSVIQIVTVVHTATAADIDTGHITLVDHTAVGGCQADVLAGDDAAGLVDDVVAGLQREAFASFDQSGVGEVVTGFGRQVVGRPQRAGVIEVAACDQSDVAALNQRPVWRQAVIRLRQIQHRHQHFFAVHFVLFEPDDVMGQRGDLLRGQGDAH
ncbi:hypothetical protein D3C81_1373590 [compost metagenome]